MPWVFKARNSAILSISSMMEGSSRKKVGFLINSKQSTGPTKFKLAEGVLCTWEWLKQGLSKYYWRVFMKIMVTWLKNNTVPFHKTGHCSLLIVQKWGNPKCIHLLPGFWPMGGLGFSSVPYLTVTSPLVSRLCSSHWNYRRCQSPHKGCRFAFTSQLIIRKSGLSLK